MQWARERQHGRQDHLWSFQTLRSARSPTLDNCFSNKTRSLPALWKSPTLEWSSTLGAPVPSNLVHNAAVWTCRTCRLKCGISKFWMEKIKMTECFTKDSLLCRLRSCQKGNHCLPWLSGIEPWHRGIIHVSTSLEPPIHDPTDGCILLQRLFWQHIVRDIRIGPEETSACFWGNRPYGSRRSVASALQNSWQSCALWHTVSMRNQIPFVAWDACPRAPYNT